jgi:hypothetical protein
VSEPVSIPVLDEVGRDLHRAWRRQEVHARRRTQLVVMATMIALLAVPGAIAERSVVGTAPDLKAPVAERNAGLVLTGNSPVGQWRLLSSRIGARQCVNLAVAGPPQAAYGGGCAPANGGTPLIVMPRALAGVTFVFGLTAERATRVRVALPAAGTHVVSTVAPIHRTVAARYAPSNLRYFVLVLHRSVPQLPGPFAQALDASGRVIATAGRPF